MDQVKPQKKRTNRPRKKNVVCTDDDPGCLGVLKKLTCSLQCGGTSCSIKETEQLSTSSPSASSCESLSPPVKMSRKRRPPKSTTPHEGGEGVAPVKRVRRSPKKSVPDVKVTLPE